MHYTHDHLLAEAGFMRLKDVLRHIPVSKSTWWEGVKSGRYPAPVKLGPRTTAWRVKDILELSQLLVEGRDWTSRSAAKAEPAPLRMD